MIFSAKNGSEGLAYMHKVRTNAKHICVLHTYMYIYLHIIPSY